MKAAWDWHLPRETAAEQEALVAFTRDLGFDTLIIHNPTPAILRAAGEAGIKVIGIVTPNVTDAFAQQHPDALQRMLPAEDAIVAAVAGFAWDQYTVCAHRWYPIVQTGQTLCFESPAAREELKARISQVLAVADGVAFDGFGYRNHYACFCERCQHMRREAAAEHPAWHEAQVLAQTAEESLLTLSHILYDHARAEKPDAIVTNHVWPPFRPHPYYASRLKLDYCSQTISWFYRPVWSLERVAFEAQQMKAQEDTQYNRFVPFIGMFDHPYLARSPERIAQELAIAQEYGEGHLVFCSLQSLQRYPDVGSVVKTTLAE